MACVKDTSSPASARQTLSRKRRVNWHEAAVCAVQIELRDFADFLEFHTEYILGKNNYRIDLLVIKMLSGRRIAKNIARFFTTYNLFEIKGAHSSLTANAYYKTIGYAGLFLDQANSSGCYTSMDVSISFLSFHYPGKLIRNLRKNSNFTIEKYSDGIYYINNETFKIQIIVTHELPPEENLYLCCLTEHLQDTSMMERLAADYMKHRESEIYNKYLCQLSTANRKAKGDSSMVNEWLFNFFGTSSEEIIARARQEADDYYLPKLDELTATNEQLSSQVNHLETLLKQYNISYE